MNIETLRQTLAATGPTVEPTARLTQSAGPAEHLTPTPTQTSIPVVGNTFIYYTRSGDTPLSLAARFQIGLEQIPIPDGRGAEQFLEPGLRYVFPNTLTGLTLTPGELILPNNEIVYSPTSTDFKHFDYIQESGGFLSQYQEEVDGRMLSGSQIIDRVALELSLNPRLLLALLELRGGWLTNTSLPTAQIQHPLGFYIPGRSGLYEELSIAGTQINLAYYGWREGSFTSLRFPDGQIRRLNPALNAGSAALQHLFALLYREPEWQIVLYGEDSFAERYQGLFGDAWNRSAAFEPHLPPDLQQPALELPFLPGERWSLTAGPHTSWNTGTPRGALDFSPVTGEPVCIVSRVWVTASAPGIVVRAAENAVALDLDGDGYEQTGWVLFYYHIASAEMIPAGTRVNLNDPLGHPSCEGGRATGKHVHVARKYNGEWLPADGAVPFVLSGWQAIAGERNYAGRLVKGGQVVYSNPSGSQTSIIVR